MEAWHWRQLPGCGRSLVRRVLSWSWSDQAWPRALLYSSSKAYPAKMRLSRGSLSRCEKGTLPPYLVACISRVRLKPSYSRGKFLPHSAGSTVSSVSFTTSTKVSRASRLRWLTLINNSTTAPISTTPVNSR